MRCKRPCAELQKSPLWASWRVGERVVRLRQSLTDSDEDVRGVCRVLSLRSSSAHTPLLPSLNPLPAHERGRLIPVVAPSFFTSTDSPLCVKAFPLWRGDERARGLPLAEISQRVNYYDRCDPSCDRQISAARLIQSTCETRHWKFVEKRVSQLEDEPPRPPRTRQI